MLEFVPLVAAVTLVIALVNFFKALKAGNFNTVVTQLIVWVVGVVVIFLFGETDWSTTVVIADLNLDDLNTWSKIFVGLTLASTAMFANELKKAIDNTDTAAHPPFIEE
jgi:hypothetical protein